MFRFVFAKAGGVKLLKFLALSTVLVLGCSPNETRQTAPPTSVQSADGPMGVAEFANGVDKLIEFKGTLEESDSGFSIRFSARANHAGIVVERVLPGMSLEIENEGITGSVGLETFDDPMSVNLVKGKFVEFKTSRLGRTIKGRPIEASILVQISGYDEPQIVSTALDFPRQ